MRGARFEVLERSGDIGRIRKGLPSSFGSMLEAVLRSRSGTPIVNRAY
jgi:hypothetical protein